MRNKGSATVEACLVVPFVLFFMLFFYGIGMLILAEAHIHQSLAEAAGVVAEQAYLEQKLLNTNNAKSMEGIWNYTMLVQKFRTYLGKDKQVERVIANGKNGVILTMKQEDENPKIFVVSAHYRGRISIPVLGNYELPMSNQIRQKAFVGYDASEQETEDYYEYVTPNQSVYHMKRSCTHLQLSVQTCSLFQAANYETCHFCGSQKGEQAYISKTSTVVHFNKNCSGLKRTVRRVKRKSVGELGACTRCGR